MIYFVLNKRQHKWLIVTQPMTFSLVTIAINCAAPFVSEQHLKRRIFDNNNFEKSMTGRFNQEPSCTPGLR